MTCRDCEREVVTFRGKPGFIDQCEACALMVGDVPLLGGNMIYSHKTAPELEIKPLDEAREFNRLMRRQGAGVARSLVAKKSTFETRESGKAGSGTENRAQYYSRLGERRVVKL